LVRDGQIQAAEPSAKPISAWKKDYRYRIGYAAAIWDIDLLQCDDPIFESVS
jgi:hypothetical protein